MSDTSLHAEDFHCKIPGFCHVVVVFCHLVFMQCWLVVVHGFSDSRR